jgi:hypothetical protein
MVTKMKTNKLALIIDCGVDDFLLESNRELHRRLVYDKVAHDYTERPGHIPGILGKCIALSSAFFSKVLKTNTVSLQ